MIKTRQEKYKERQICGEGEWHAAVMVAILGWQLTASLRTLAFCEAMVGADCCLQRLHSATT